MYPWCKRRLTVTDRPSASPPAHTHTYRLVQPRAFLGELRGAVLSGNLLPHFGSHSPGGVGGVAQKLSETYPLGLEISLRDTRPREGHVQGHGKVDQASITHRHGGQEKEEFRRMGSSEQTWYYRGTVTRHACVTRSELDTVLGYFRVGSQKVWWGNLHV